MKNNPDVGSRIAALTQEQSATNSQLTQLTEHARSLEEQLRDLRAQHEALLRCLQQTGVLQSHLLEEEIRGGFKGTSTCPSAANTSCTSTVSATQSEKKMPRRVASSFQLGPSGAAAAEAAGQLLAVSSQPSLNTSATSLSAPDVLPAEEAQGAAQPNTSPTIVPPGPAPTVGGAVQAARGRTRDVGHPRATAPTLRKAPPGPVSCRTTADKRASSPPRTPPRSSSPGTKYRGIQQRGAKELPGQKEAQPSSPTRTGAADPTWKSKAAGDPSGKSAPARTVSPQGRVARNPQTPRRGRSQETDRPSRLRQMGMAIQGMKSESDGDDDGLDLYRVITKLLDAGCTPSEHNHGMRLVQRILKNTNKPPNTWSGPSTPLNAAVKAGRIDLARLLIRARATANDKDAKGVTALHLASYDGNTDLCKLLITSRADIDACDCYGQSPLFFVPSWEVCKLLVERKSDVNILNTRGRSALHLAGRAGLHKVLAWLAGRVSKQLLELQDAQGNTAWSYLQEAAVGKPKPSSGAGRMSAAATNGTPPSPPTAQQLAGNDRNRRVSPRRASDGPEAALGIGGVDPYGSDGDGLTDMQLKSLQKAGDQPGSAARLDSGPSADPDRFQAFDLSTPGSTTRQTRPSTIEVVYDALNKEKKTQNAQAEASAKALQAAAEVATITMAAAAELDAFSGKNSVMFDHAEGAVPSEMFNQKASVTVEKSKDQSFPKHWRANAPANQQAEGTEQVDNGSAPTESEQESSKSKEVENTTKDEEAAGGESW